MPAEAAGVARDVTLRSLIQESWSARHAALRARSARQPVSAPASSLRQQIFQQVIQRAERMPGGVIGRERVREIIDEWRASLPPMAPLVSADELELDVMDEISGLGPLGRLVRDPTISDILVNGPYQVWVDRFGRLERTGIRFDDEQHLRRVIRRVVANQGRRLDESAPCVDVRLPDGSRLNVVLAPVSVGGTTVSIRRVRGNPLRLDDLIAFGTLTREMADLLVEVIRSKMNVVIAGGAGAGKTTLLNVLSASIPEEERIVTIEETAELRLEHPHVVNLETRLPNAEGVGGVDLRTLVRNALRMRADRIIVGEVRGAEAFEMLQAMHIGHDGSLTTIHASSPRDAIRRLETLVLAGGSGIPAEAIAEIVGSAVHVIVQMTRFSDGTRRVESIAEVQGLESGLAVRELFTYSRESGHFEPAVALSDFELRLFRRREKE